MKHALFAFFVLSSALCGAENVDIWDTKPLGPAVKVPAIPKPRVQRKAVLNRVFKPLKGEDLILSRNACIVTDRETENRITARLLSQKVKAASGYTLPVWDESKVKIVQKNDRPGRAENKRVQGTSIHWFWMDFQQMYKKTVFGILRAAFPLVTAEKVQMPDFAHRRKAAKRN